MNEQQRIDSLKRRYSRSQAPAAKGPMGGPGHGPGRHMNRAGKGKPRNSRETIKRLMDYLNEDRPKMALAFVCVIIGTGSTLAGAYMLRPIINTFIAPVDGSAGDPAGLADPW